MISCKDPKFAEVFPRPTDNVASRLRHVLDLYAASPDDMVVVTGTLNAYGPGITTGLTLGDLRKINDTLTSTAFELREIHDAVIVGD